MNLLSHLEINRYMFWIVSTGIVGGMLAMGLNVVNYAKRKNLF